MKAMIYEIEEFEVTDPAGCCNPPALAPGVHGPGDTRPPTIPLPDQWSKPRTPMIPSSPAPTPLPEIPGWGDIKPTHVPPIYSSALHDPSDPLHQAKWGTAGSMIHGVGDGENAKNTG